MTSIKYVFWDYDNTILHTAENHWLKNKVVLARYGIDLPEEHKHRVFLLGSDQNWEWMREELDFKATKEDYKREVDEWFKENAKTLKFRSGVEDALQFFKGKNIPQGIVSNGRTNSVHNGLKAKNLMPYFDVILCKEDYEKRKPDPAPYIKAIESMEKIHGNQIAPNTCLAIEDEEKGLKSAEAAGMQVIFRPLGDEGDLMQKISEKLI